MKTSKPSVTEVAVASASAKHPKRKRARVIVRRRSRRMKIGPIHAELRKAEEEATRFFLFARDALALFLTKISHHSDPEELQADMEFACARFEVLEEHADNLRAIKVRLETASYNK